MTPSWLGIIALGLVCRPATGGDDDLLFLDSFERCDIAYIDADADGFGDIKDAGVFMCGPLQGLSFDNTDCNDQDPQTYPGAPERCDGLDNDCDVVVDEDLIPPLNSNQLGACAGTTQVCAGVAGWTDDYSGVPLFGQFEVPDASFFDENCDGLDGDADSAVYVAPTGSDDPGCGSVEQPCRSIAVALREAAAQALPHVYVSAGAYAEGPLDVSGEVFGGFDVNWERDDRNQPGHLVEVRDPDPSVDGAIGLEVFAPMLLLADLQVVGPTAPQQLDRNSYGLLFREASGDYFIERVSVIAGNGFGGANGSPGESFPIDQALPGSSGEDGVEEARGCSIGRPLGGSGADNPACPDTRGGNGGSGGSMDTTCNFTGTCSDCSARPGLPGSNAALTSPGFGQGGVGGLTCQSGGVGQNGRTFNGTPGAGGSGGAVIAGLWESSDGDAGTLGLDGTGGGGGGGAGGCDIDIDEEGGGGGGGGAGGCRAGSPGSGGRGGGASFGIYVVGASLSIDDVLVVRGAGGDGGAGGNGAAGQIGGFPGTGGAEAGDTGPGGNGGRGGDGGNSGGGGGGAGGISCGIALSSGATLDSAAGLTVTGGAAGQGGPGGAGVTRGAPGTGVPGQPGAPGTLDEICDLDLL